MNSTIQPIQHNSRMYKPQLTPQGSSPSDVKNIGHAQQPETTKSARASATIIDVLNAYCWQVVLDNLDINDVVRSERVSRDWQRIVLEYLQGVHKFGIKNADRYRPGFNQFSGYDRTINIHFQNKDNFDRMIQKIGPSVVQLSTDSICDRTLLTIAENCLNIEKIRFYNTHFDDLKSPTVVEVAMQNLKLLKRISFETCRQLEHFCSHAFIEKETFEELELINSYQEPNNFWLDFKSINLKSLTLSCFSRWLYFDWRIVQTASNNWTRLTKLQLDNNSSQMLQLLHIILENIPNLEHFSLCGYAKYYPTCVDHYGSIQHNKSSTCCVQAVREWNDRLVESICRHSGLKHLHLARNGNVSDDWLETLARSCRELRTLDIGSCQLVSGWGLAALRARTPALATLRLPDNLRVADADLIDCVSFCHNLTYLDASRCAGATPRLVAAAERATRRRASPLRLRLDETDMSTDQILKAAGFEEETRKRLRSYAWYLPQQIQARHKGLTLQWINKAPEAHLPLRGPLAEAHRSGLVLSQTSLQGQRPN